MFRTIGAKQYLQELNLQVEPQRVNPKPRKKGDIKKKLKKLKKGKSTEIEKLKAKYGKDFILQLLLMILKGKDIGGKKTEKKKKDKKDTGFKGMRRRKGGGGGGFQTKTDLNKQRSAQNKAASLASIRKPKPGETPEQTKDRVLRETLSQLDPVQGILYELTGGLQLKQSNYDGKDLGGAIAYTRQLVKGLEELDKKEAAEGITPETQLRRKQLESESVKTTRQFTGKSFDAIYEGSKDTAISEGETLGRAFAKSTLTDTLDDDDLSILGDLNSLFDTSSEEEGAVSPLLREVKKKKLKPDYSGPKVKVGAESDTDVEIEEVFSRGAKGDTSKFKPKRPPGASPSREERLNFDFETRAKTGKLDRKEFAKKLSGDEQTTYLLDLFGKASQNLPPNDALFSGWIAEDGEPFDRDTLYEQYLGVTGSERRPASARVTRVFKKEFSGIRYEINNKLGQKWNKSITDYLNRFITEFGYGSWEEIPEKYLTGFFTSEVEKGTKRSEQRLTKEELLSQAQDARESLGKSPVLGPAKPLGEIPESDLEGGSSGSGGASPIRGGGGRPQPKPVSPPSSGAETSFDEQTKLGEFLNQDEIDTKEAIKLSLSGKQVVGGGSYGQLNQKRKKVANAVLDDAIGSAVLLRDLRREEYKKLLAKAPAAAAAAAISGKFPGPPPGLPPKKEPPPQSVIPELREPPQYLTTSSSSSSSSESPGSGDDYDPDAERAKYRGEAIQRRNQRQNLGAGTLDYLSDVAREVKKTPSTLTQEIEKPLIFDFKQLPETEIPGIPPPLSEATLVPPQQRQQQRRRGPKKVTPEQTQSNLEKKLARYDALINQLNLSEVPEDNREAERREIKERIKSKIEGGTTDNQPKKLQGFIDSYVKRLSKGKTLIGFGEGGDKGLSGKKEPKFGKKSAIKKGEDLYTYIGKDGKEYKLLDSYPEAARIAELLKDAEKGGVSKKKIAEYKSQLKKLDRDFRWSLRDIEQGLEIGKSGYSDKPVEELNKDLDSLISSLEKQGSVIISGGEKGVTVQNSAGFYKFIDKPDRDIAEQQKADEKEAENKSREIEDEREREQRDSQERINRMAERKEAEFVESSGKDSSDKDGSGGGGVGLFPRDQSTGTGNATVTEGEETIEDEQTEEDRTRSRRRKKKLAERKETQEETDEILTEQIKPKAAKAVIDTTRMKENKRKVEELEKKTKLTKGEKGRLQKLKASVARAETKLQKQQQVIEQTEEQIKVAPRFNIEDTYGLLTETESEGGTVKPIQITSQAQLEERIKRKQGKDKDFDEKRYVDDYALDYLEQLQSGRVGPVLTESQKLRQKQRTQRKLAEEQKQKRDTLGDQFDEFITQDFSGMGAASSSEKQGRLQQLRANRKQFNKDKGLRLISAIGDIKGEDAINRRELARNAYLDARREDVRLREIDRLVKEGMSNKDARKATEYIDFISKQELNASSYDPTDKIFSPDLKKLLRANATDEEIRKEVKRQREINEIEKSLGRVVKKVEDTVRAEYTRDSKVAFDRNPITTSDEERYYEKMDTAMKGDRDAKRQTKEDIAKFKTDEQAREDKIRTELEKEYSGLKKLDYSKYIRRFNKELKKRLTGVGSSSESEEIQSSSGESLVDDPRDGGVTLSIGGINFKGGGGKRQQIPRSRAEELTEEIKQQKKEKRALLAAEKSVEVLPGSSSDSPGVELDVDDYGYGSSEYSFGSDPGLSRFEKDLQRGTPTGEYIETAGQFAEDNQRFFEALDEQGQASSADDEFVIEEDEE